LEAWICISGVADVELTSEVAESSVAETPIADEPVETQANLDSSVQNAASDMAKPEKACESVENCPWTRGA